MATRYTIYLMGFKTGANADEIDRYLEEILSHKDPTIRKKLVFETPSFLFESEDESLAGAIKTELEDLGCRVEVRRRMVVVASPPSAPTRESSAYSDIGLVENKLWNKPAVRYVFFGLVGAFLALLVGLMVRLAGGNEQTLPGDVSEMRGTEVSPNPSPGARPPTITNTRVEDEAPTLDVVPSATSELELGESAPDALKQALEQIERGEIEEAVAALEQWVADHPNDREGAEALSFAIVKKAEKDFRGNNLEEAGTLLEKAYELAPDNSTVLAYLGAYYFYTKDYDKALEFLNRSVDKGSKDPDVHSIMAFIYYYHKDDMESAEKHLTLALEIAPERADLAALLDKIRRERGVEDSLEKATGVNFTVKYDGMEDRNAGYIVLYELERAYSSIGYDLGNYPNDSITVILYTTQQFREVVGAPHWAGGAYDGKIRLPVGGLPDRDDDNLKRLLFHEYTHAVIHRITNNNCPIWLNEGLAQVMQERSGASRDPWLRVDALRGRAIPKLYTLSAPFVRLDAESAGLAYTESYYATQFMIEQYGLSGVRQVLNELGKGADFYGTFEATLGTPFGVFENRFYDWLRTKVE